MKKILFLSPVLFTFCVAQAQLCNEAAEVKIKSIELAASNADMHNGRAYDSLRKEMNVAFVLLEKCAAQNPSYEARTKLRKINLYFSLSEVAGQAGRYSDMLKNIESMERLLPSPTAISSSAASAFSINGTNFTSNSDYDYISGLYYKIIERRVNYYYFGEGSNSKVIEWYEKINNAPSNFERSSLEALLYADALYKNGKPTETYFPAMAKAVQLTGLEWAKTEVHDSAEINNKDLMLRWFNREISEYNKSKLNTADPGGKYRMMSARGLWDVNEKELAKQYAFSASEAGYSGSADGYWYLDVAAGNDAKHISAALRILEYSVPSMTENEMDRLLPLAERYGLNSMVDAIRSKKRKILALRRRSKISLTPGIELIGLPCGHIPVSLNLRTGRVMQEFMFDYVWGAKTKYRFGRAFAKGDKGDRYEFTGWDAGYAINVILGRDFRQGNKPVGRSKFFVPAMGLDFRYANWNFEQITTDRYDKNDVFLQSGVNVNATTIRYEVCYRTSFVVMTRFFQLQYWVGLGVGYRTLKTQEGYNLKDDHFSDPRLDHNRWNKIYMPLRLGLKIGFNIL